MSSFTDDLLLTELAVNWRVEKPFVYEVGAKGSGRAITVPLGFVTDGASVPQFLWVFFPAWGSYSRAVVVHDLLCHLINDGTPHKEAPDRTAAAKVFREAMKVCGTGWLTRTVLYLGVRLGEYLPGKNIVETYNPQPGSAGPGACRKVFPTDVRAARERSTA